MIKINLLPVKEELKKIAIRNNIIVFVLSLIVVILVMVIMQNSIINRKNEVNKNISDIDIEIKRLKKITSKIPQTKNKKDELKEKLKVIQNLEKNRLLPVIILETLTKDVPNQLWFTSLVFQGGKIAITGKSLDHTLVAEFIKNLEKEKYFSNVVLKGTTMSTEGHWDIVSFDLIVDVNLTGKKQN